MRINVRRSNHRRQTVREVARNTVARLEGHMSPLAPLHEYTTEIADLAHLYWTGVTDQVGARDLAVILNYVAPTFGEAEPIRDEDAAGEIARRAKQEANQGFRRLNAHLLVGLCGVLDTAVDEWVCWWLENRPERLTCEKSTVRISPAALMGDASSRSRELYTALRQEQGASLRSGISRYESAAQLVGLSGPVPAAIADGYYELQQVRNAYAHSGGSADRRFVEACPWTELEVGDPIPVPPAAFHHYLSVVSAYLELLLVRGWAAHGIRVQDPGRLYVWDRKLSPNGDFSASLRIQVSESTPLRVSAHEAE